MTSAKKVVKLLHHETINPEIRRMHSLQLLNAFCTYAFDILRKLERMHDSSELLISSNIIKEAFGKSLHALFMCFAFSFTSFTVNDQLLMGSECIHENYSSKLMM